MTWAYGGGEKVQVDLFDIQVPEDVYKVSEGELKNHHHLTPSSLPLAGEPLQFIRKQALGRAATVANELYETAPQPTREREWRIFGRSVRGDWTTADLVAPSNLRFLLGVLDQPLDQRQAGTLRRARNAPSAAQDADPIQIAITQRILVVVARDSTEDPDWSEVARRIEQPGQ